ncbi:P protein [Drosophila elegans]|uniref:P protein n=1 Tax=Drosophila elegans TaxID=30023 RepID=UPI0007E80A4D|nr:P protein [Drosophila elegans]
MYTYQMKILSNPFLAFNARRLGERGSQAWPTLRRTRSYTAQISGVASLQEDDDGQQRPSARHRLIIHLVKMCILLLLWFVCTFIVFSYAVDKNPRSTMVTVMPNETALRTVKLPGNGVRVTLQGPVDGHLMRFPDEHSGGYGAGLRVEWRNPDLNVTHRRTDMWNIVIDSDATKYEEVSKKFVLPRTGGEDAQAVISLENWLDSPVSLHMTLDTGPPITDMGVLYAGLLIVGLYMLIIFDVIDHTFAALIIATTGIATLTILDHRPNVHSIISFVNFEPLMLLFGLMTIVDIMATTGVFDYLVVGTYRLARGRPWPLIFLLSMLTALLSALLNSDIMALALTPMTIRLCEEMSLRTTYVLVVVAIFADMGGALTPMGNPPNAIVTTNPAVMAEGVDFVTFVAHMLPGVLAAMLVVCAIVYVTHRTSIFEVDQHQRDLVEKRTGPKKQPSQATLERIAKLREVVPSRYWLKPAENYAETLAALEASSRIRNKPLLIKGCLALTFALICMVLHSIPHVAAGATLGWVTLLAAFLLIILDDKNDLNATLGIIQWNILLFIAALFVLSEAVDQLGFFQWLGDHTAVLLRSLKPEYQTAVTIVGLLWTTALLTILIDNAAVTIFMLKFSFQMASNDDVPLPPMIWALTFGACFGGNGSLFGAVSNEIIVQIALQHGYRISFCHFFIIGFPLMLATMVIGSAYLLIAHTALSWN